MARADRRILVKQPLEIIWRSRATIFRPASAAGAGGNRRWLAVPDGT